MKLASGGSDFAKGKGRFFTNIDYVYRQEIFLRDRPFSASANHTAVAPAPFNVVGSGYDGRSAVLFPTYRLGANATSGTTRYFRPASGAGSTPADTTVAPTRAANPEAFNDINLYQQGAPRSARFNTYSSFEYDLNSRVTAFGDVAYYHAKSDLIRQPIALNYPGADSLVIQNMSIDNPFNPFGNRFVSTTGARPGQTQFCIDGSRRRIHRLIGRPSTLQAMPTAHFDRPGCPGQEKPMAGPAVTGVATADDGPHVNSGPLDGLDKAAAIDAIDKIIEFVHREMR